MAFFEDDSWINPVAPVADTLYQRLPLGDRESLPADTFAKLSQYVIEVVSGSVGNVRTSQFVIEVITARPPVIDEDFWRFPQAAPRPSELYQRLPLGDVENLPAGFLFIPPQVEDEYWLQLVAPQTAKLHVQLPLGDKDEIPAGHLFTNFAIVTQFFLEVITSYNHNPYTGWTETSMSSQ